MKVYDTIADARRQAEFLDLIPDPATDLVFMAAVIAGGNVPWCDRPESERRDDLVPPSARVRASPK